MLEWETLTIALLQQEWGHVSSMHMDLDLKGGKCLE